VATSLVCTALVVAIVKLKKTATLADSLALRPLDPRALRAWLVLLVAMLAAFDLLALALGRPIVPPFMREAYASAQPVWLIWVALIVAAPLFEEVFFRGFLFRGLAASALGARATVVATALVWAVIHVQYDALDIALVFAMGLLFGAARLRSGSLLAPLALHAAANLAATVETALLV
jgi:membrane protease YdiL (CAAX protease family)